MKGLKDQDPVQCSSEESDLVFRRFARVWLQSSLLVVLQLVFLCIFGWSCEVCIWWQEALSWSERPCYEGSQGHAVFEQQ
mmetsp:Transcript_6179/g.19845  ORF Transcript_6179/g.19845 Transcript_6179/m.19845 type:complete len:80 (+) Transcript_6179:153-392(+)